MWCGYYTHSTTQFKPATFQVLHSHVWLVGAILDSTAFNIINIKTLLSSPSLPEVDLLIWPGRGQCWRTESQLFGAQGIFICGQEPGLWTLTHMKKSSYTQARKGGLEKKDIPDYLKTLGVFVLMLI